MHLSDTGFVPFLASLLSAVPLNLNSSLLCLAHGSLTHNSQNINNDTLDCPSPPAPLAAKPAMGYKR